MRLRSGFALIDFLTMFAIIGMLSATLLPVLRGAARDSQQQSCMANSNSVSRAILMYASDWDNQFPLGVDEHWASGPTSPGAGGQEGCQPCPPRPPRPPLNP